MSARDKLIESIRNNHKDVRFSDAMKVAGWLGFKKSGGKGAHCAFAKRGEPVGLNFQDRSGKVPPYQVKQLLLMVDKYYEPESNE